MSSLYSPANYVGVSGVSNPDQQVELREYAREVFAEVDVVLALGVKAVHKTQWLDVPNKYGEAWYPVGEEQFANSLGFYGGTDNIAQVYLEPEVLAADPQYATNFIRRIKQRGQNWLHMIQFDMLPYHEAPEAFGYVIHEAKRETRELGDGYSVIVQCHAPAMSEGPVTALEKLKRLSPDEINYVLFDASHGKGREMNPDELKRFLEVAYSDEDFAHVGFGIAGGLDGEAVERHLPSILADFPETSWDAEGRLHQTPDGTLDIDKAKDYLARSAQVLKGA